VQHVYGIDEGLGSPPPAGTSTLFSVFDGANPNGTWSLTIDNASPDVASLSEGWALTITADASGSVTEPPPPLPPSHRRSSCSAPAYSVSQVPSVASFFSLR